MIFRKSWRILLLTLLLTITFPISAQDNEKIPARTVTIYGASWCPACKKLEKFLEDNWSKIIREADLMYIGYIDLDKEKDIKRPPEVRVFPTTFKYNYDKLLSKKEGFDEKQWFEWVKK